MLMFIKIYICDINFQKKIIMNFSSFGYKCRFFLAKTGFIQSFFSYSGLLAKTSRWKVKVILERGFLSRQASRRICSTKPNDSSIFVGMYESAFPVSFVWPLTSRSPIASKVDFICSMPRAPGLRAICKWEKAGICLMPFFRLLPLIAREGSAVFKFQQNLTWNDWETQEDGGLFVCVLNNGTDWKEYEVRNGFGWSWLPEPDECWNEHDPVAQFQPRVYLRFQWREFMPVRMVHQIDFRTSPMWM